MFYCPGLFACIAQDYIVCYVTYRKFSNKGAGSGGKALLERGHFHLPAAFYRMKIGLFLAEIWPKTSRNPMALESKGGGALIGGGALNGEFTVYCHNYCQIIIAIK